SGTRARGRFRRGGCFQALRGVVWRAGESRHRPRRSAPRTRKVGRAMQPPPRTRPEVGDEERSLPDELGLLDELEPDAEAPPVDRDLVRQYVQRTLSPEAAGAVADLILLYRPWRRALGEALAHEFKEWRPPGGGPGGARPPQRGGRRR